MEILELPGNIDHSELHVYNYTADQAHALPKTIAWVTGTDIHRLLTIL